MPEIKAKLAATPDGLFLVGGAMMHVRGSSLTLRLLVDSSVPYRGGEVAHIHTI